MERDLSFDNSIGLTGLRQDEAGKAAAWAVLVLITLGFGYYGYINGHILHTLPRFYAQLILAVGSILSLFVLGAQLSISLAGGGSSKNALIRHLSNDILKLRACLEQVELDLKQIETDIAQSGHALSPHGYECLSAAHRLCEILARTAKDTEELLGSDNSYALSDARELIDQQTISFEGLRKITVGGNQVPLLTPIEWAELLPALVREVRVSIRRAAA